MSVSTPRRENGRRRPVGYADWRPQAKTRLLLGQVAAVLAEYDDQLPLTVRQVFYRLVGAHGYAKSEHAYKNLCELLARARRAQLVPFASIRDDGVSVMEAQWYASPEDWWDDAGRRIERYQRDRQQGQAHRLELWCEAAGMMPQLERIAGAYSVPVFSAGGFLSLSAVRLIVDRARQRDHKTVILHVGDYDPSGHSIFDRMIADAQAFLVNDRLLALQEVIGQRVSLTEEQVGLYALPTSPPKASDSRSAAWQGETCQVEALAPDALAAIVDDAIRGWFDLDLVQGEIGAERRDRIAIRALMPGGDG
jgi:hypothetical protein